MHEATAEQATAREASLAQELAEIKAGIADIKQQLDALRDFIVDMMGARRISTLPINSEQNIQETIAMLRSWREEGDAEEQRETWEYLKKALSDDRP